ncbi:hypothetical protein LO772_00920 [Yinghuangia sp. ASG 101]|uniref:hypothetical protein n=1 Tax=Yinghuangia sp. ASG 101 TaxID=2896848 RepID=UPI001E4D5CDE|nr:hypothetical protein [Yinghuangia sp. ASG 101]UGQ12206.1 hypothetical protein LO772_00920 [Yinghuangia sp. ASG 101]
MPIANSRIARAATLALTLVVAAGCSGGSPSRPCTLVATMPGIGVHVAAPLADGAGDVQARVCQEGACRDVTARLQPATGTGANGCDGDVCSAVATPLPDKRGFLDLPGITTAPALLTLTVRDASGAVLTTGEITVTPEETHPNGPDCGGGDAQAQVLVTAEAVTAL